MDEMMLDALFKKGSKARQVAQLLLSGEARTRKELAETVGVSETTIPRVINALEGAGVEIETRTDRSRQATYVATGGASWGNLRGASAELPEGITAYYGISQGEPAVVSITASEKNGSQFQMTFDLNGMEAVGNVIPVEGRSLPTAVIVGGDVKLFGIMMFPDGRAGYRLTDDSGAAVDVVLVDLKKAPQAAKARKKAGVR